MKATSFRGQRVTVGMIVEQIGSGVALIKLEKDTGWFVVFVHDRQIDNAFGPFPTETIAEAEAQSVIMRMAMDDAMATEPGRTGEHGEGENSPSFLCY